ncbi:SusC/RagA family TonB-linked outer membrane protein [Pedobacter sp. ISL-68]|uniref:SusC/RagA family TonB-linked outer membrane protein n=1 Tax=unclassified Pedobacter TaxID=2628915 RepID=UPI001BEC8BB2|nr:MULTISPECIES: SusC/RagA family TonB-linked outer membrane protein [unclassified Pedobacter]MBT2563755.1 SusC/RagA family TonB-linked outer membrane protein [Pedobacter sp. ISL-64]MBT2589647.1 SusC/RagA family TonB-linked outer membrane protein [Pedobacter sp. ISL-68]
MIKAILFICTALLAVQTLHAQNTLKGKVTDLQTGKSMRANITIPALKIKAQTDSAGFFELAVAKGPWNLRISAIGYRTVDTLIKQPNQNLSFSLLPESYYLKDVTVSTGYQQVKRERLTGAYQQIDTKTLNEQVSTNILDRLEAVGNGLTIDRTTTGGRITIRGLSSISGPKDVLVILDNFPYEGDLSNINPNDVESISILKDAAATSIWGSRAGNGVIVITSKKGRYNSRLTISANAVSTFIQKPDLYKIPQMSVSDYIDVEQFLFDQGAYLSDYNSPAHVGLSPVIEALYDPNLNTTQKKAVIDGFRQHDVRDDFNRYFYKTGINQQYSIQLAGGGEKYGWTASAGYDRNSSDLGATFNRLNLRYGLNITLLKNLKADISMAYTGSDSKSGKTAFGMVNAHKGSLYPYAKLADDNRNALPIAQNYRLSYLSTLDKRLLDWKYYPLTEDEHNTLTSRLDDININTGLSYNFKGIDLKFLYRFERQTTASETLQDLGSFTTRNWINSFTQISGTTLSYPFPMGAIDIKNNSILTANDLRLQASYTKRFSRHGIEMLIGGEQRERADNGNTNRFYGYNPELLTSVPVDYVNRYPNYISGNLAFIPNGAGLSGTNNRYLSLFGNLTYDYDGKYFLYGSARRDASNLFGLNTNDKWKPLWSLGSAWVISRADFMKDVPIGFLKVRASFGYSGNADPTKVALTTISYSDPRAFTRLPFATINRFFNPDLKWETVQTLNLGLDFRLLKERISGSLDFYVKKGKDLFSSVPVDYTTGIGATVIRNVASMRGSGVDLNLNTLNFKGEFAWETNLNLSTNHDRITDFYRAPTTAGNFIGGSVRISGLVGSPVYSIFSYRSPGLDSTGDPIGYINGVPSKDYNQITRSETNLDDLKFSGSALPTFFGNLQNRFSYEGFSLQVAISFKAGYYFRRSSIDYGALVYSVDGHPDFAQRWQKPGDELITNVPAFRYPVIGDSDNFYTYSEVLVEKADHIRLQYINLAYSLPKKILGRTIRSCEVFANSTNLGILWSANKKGIDPEYQDGILPPKTLSAGIRINF